VTRCGGVGVVDEAVDALDGGVVADDVGVHGQVSSR
jgi:hypothetical protein